jgi:hypothetical protein
MKKAVPVIVIAVLGAGLGLLVWWVTRPAHTELPPDNTQVQANEDFAAEDFIPTFDLDGDGRVTLEEFQQRYGQPLAEGQPPLIFHEGNDGPALSAEEAFKRWDLDASGVVDAADMKRIKSKAWRNFQARAEKLRLKATSFGDRWLMLNEHQLGAFEAEQGAHARGDLPYAGKRTATCARASPGATKDAFTCWVTMRGFRSSTLTVSPLSRRRPRIPTTCTPPRFATCPSTTPPAALPWHASASNGG